MCVLARCFNENTSENARFFGIELQVVRIGASDPAPPFNVVVQPNDWQKQARAATQAAAVSGKGALYITFWQRFLERVHEERPDWTKAKRTPTDNWFDLKAPIAGAHFSVSFAQGDRLRSELYIDGGDADENMQLFESLHDQRMLLEEAYGGSLEWQDLPGKRACRVADYRDDCSVSQSERYDEFIDWFIDSGTRLRAALQSLSLLSARLARNRRCPNSHGLQRTPAPSSSSAGIELGSGKVSP